MSKCKFPWLLSNVYDRCTGKPLAGAKESLIINWEGVKVSISTVFSQHTFPKFHNDLICILHLAK